MTTKYRLSNNQAHKYHLHDFNGYRLATATSLEYAKRIARHLSQRENANIPVQVCWSSRGSFGTTHHVLWFRDSRGYPNMAYATNGQWMKGKR